MVPGPENSAGARFVTGLLPNQYRPQTVRLACEDLVGLQRVEGIELRHVEGVLDDIVQKACQARGNVDRAVDARTPLAEFALGMVRTIQEVILDDSLPGADWQKRLGQIGIQGFYSSKQARVRLQGLTGLHQPAWSVWIGRHKGCRAAEIAEMPLIS